MLFTVSTVILLQPLPSLQPSLLLDVWRENYPIESLGFFSFFFGGDVLHFLYSNVCFFVLFRMYVY